MKVGKLHPIETTVVLVVALITWLYIDFIRDEHAKIKEQSYKEQAALMQTRAEEMILSKQKATLAIALAIANERALGDAIEQNALEENYYDQFIHALDTNGLEKNIWVRLFDRELQTLYSSWNKKNGINGNHARADLLEALSLEKPISSVSVCGSDLSMRAIVPIIKEGQLVGLVEVLSRFDAISVQMRSLGVESVVLLDKEHKKTIVVPYTKMFVDDYYVANTDAPVDLMGYLRRNGVHNYINTPPKIENSYVISNYKLKNIQNKTIGYYIMFKKQDEVLNVNLDFFLYKWLGIAIVAAMAIGVIFGNFIYYRNKKQKMYYKNIIDSSSNIVMVVDAQNIVDTNKTFFIYFNHYSTIEEFQKEHRSISDFFVEEEGYIHRDMDGENWLEYLIKNPKNNFVKIVYDGKEYYFSVSASLISAEKGHYSTILSDVTAQKIYQNELEHTNITDPLTKIKNRYYYNEQIKKESASANRYFYPLSLVIFDMDHFKKINDNYGHDVGDKVLIEYTKLISSYLRDSDIFCRIGGEEFALILPHVNKSDAYKIADKIRIKVQEHKEILAVTMSFGVTEYVKGEDLESTFKRADKALYEAKNGGRNRAVVR